MPLEVVCASDKGPLGLSWDAWVGIGTLALAMVTVMAIVMSSRADRKNAARIKDREDRDAKVLAVAFQQEVHRFWAACKHLDEQRATGIDKKFLIDLCSDRQRFLMGAVGDNLANLGAFPRDIGVMIAKSYTASRSLYDMTGVPKQYIDSNFVLISHGWSVSAGLSRAMFAGTYNALCAFTGEGKPIDTK